MIKILIASEAGEKLKRLSSSTKKKFIETLADMSKGKISDLKQLALTELYFIKMGNRVLIASKENNSIIILDIMSRNQFSHEVTKSFDI